MRLLDAPTRERNRSDRDHGFRLDDAVFTGNGVLGMGGGASVLGADESTVAWSKAAGENGGRLMGCRLCQPMSGGQRVVRQKLVNDS